MKVCSFIQACSDSFLLAFVEHCERKFNRRLFIQHKNGRAEIHTASKNPETIKQLSRNIEIEFNNF